MKYFIRLAIICAAGIAQPVWAAAPDKVIISYSGAGDWGPEKTLVLAHQGQDNTLTLSLKQYNKPTITDKVALTSQEFADVWKAVKASDLEHFSPGDGRSAPDYGSYGFVIETKDGNGAPAIHRASWNYPPPNGEGLHDFYTAIAHVTHIHAKQIDPKLLWHAGTDTYIVSYSITQGKPEAVKETLILSRHGKKQEITVNYNKTSKTALLTAEEFDPIWNRILSAGLTSFTPDYDAHTVTDFGSREFRTEISAPDEKPEIHDSIWSAPLKNEYQLRSIIEGLVRLAHTHGLPVHYFSDARAG